MITDKRQITPHFHSTEFRCQHCNKIYISEKLVKNLETLFGILHTSKCIISSGYRCKDYDIQIGGFAGRHSEGLAADCIFYDKNGNIIPSKIVICAAFDSKLFTGIAKINNNYVHLDVRPYGTYYGDEPRGNSSYWTNPYTYFGVSESEVEKYTGITKKTTRYQSHGMNRKWYPNVKVGDGQYAGVFGVPMDAVYIDNLLYKVKTETRWLPEVIGRSDYAGIIGKPITAIAIKGKTYRVHIKGGNWLPWVTGYNVNDFNNGYAGNGQIIDALEIK